MDICLYQAGILCDWMQQYAEFYYAQPNTLNQKYCEGGPRDTMFVQLATDMLVCLC